jgi:hypothetical protein
MALMGDQEEAFFEESWRQTNVNAHLLQHLKQQRELEKQQDIFYTTLEDQYHAAQKKLKEEIVAAFDIMLYENAVRYGLRLYDPLSAHNHVQRLITRRQEHQCSYEICDIFHIPAGLRFPCFRNNSTLISSGIVFVCRLTGSIHICDSSCTTRYMNPENQSAGYVCEISHMVKGQYIDDLPQGKNVKISRQLIDKIESNHLVSISATNYAPHLGDSDEEDYNDYGEMEPEVQKTPKKKVKKTTEKGEPVEAEEEEDEFEPVDDEEIVLEAEPDPLEIPELNELDPDQLLIAPPLKPGGSGELSRKRKVMPIESAEDDIVPAPKKVSRPAFELPTNPDERTAHFLKNLDKREQELGQLLGILLNYESKTELWKSQLAVQSKSAHEILISYQRRAKNVFLTEIDVYMRWLSYIASHVPDLPVFLTPLDPQRYIKIVMKAWTIAAKSPYARDSSNTRFIPNFLNISLAVLYTMSSGGYTQDCALSERELPVIPAELVEYELRTLQFNLLPNAPLLETHLVPVGDLVAMKQILVKNMKISAKQKAKGWRSLKECISSTVEGYRKELFQALSKPDANKVEIIKTYIQNCGSLMCRG